MDTTHDSLNPVSTKAAMPLTPYRRERRIDIEPVLSFIALLALVVLIAGWQPQAAAPGGGQAAPAAATGLKTAAVAR